MKNRSIVVSLFGLLVLIALSMITLLKKSDNKDSSDRALLALIKNDLREFENYIQSGGDLQRQLPEIDGKIYTISEGIAFFERVQFADHLNRKKIPFLKQNGKKNFDFMTITIKKNNPDLLRQVVLERPDFSMLYGEKAYTLLHLASAWCSNKLTPILHELGGINWNETAKDGSTPLTLAAENECLPMLSYWKEKGADFKAKDGRGKSALNFLQASKDAALNAFALSFESKKEKIIVVEKTKSSAPNFYKKRKIPKDQMVDHTYMLEPEDRPLEANQSAESSEFAD